jgi:hypothetical protein
MPKFTGKEFIKISGSIGALMGARVDVFAVYKIRKFIAEAKEHLAALEEARIGLVKKHGVPADDQGNFKVEPDKIDGFNTEWDKVLAEDVVLPNVTIKIRDLDKAGLTVNDIVNLDFMLDQEDDGREALVKNVHELTPSRRNND